MLSLMWSQLNVPTPTPPVPAEQPNRLLRPHVQAKVP